MTENINHALNARCLPALTMAVCSLALSGCGQDLLGAAATGAATKKRELEQGQAVQQQVDDQLKKAMGQIQQRNEQLESGPSR